MPHGKLIHGFLTHANAVAHDMEDTNSWADENLHMLIRQDHETAWSLITSIIQNVSDIKTLDYISAGVLEDLICEHPYKLIDRIEVLAGQDAQFKQALSNVWGWNSLPNDILARIDKIVAK